MNEKEVDLKIAEYASAYQAGRRHERDRILQLLYSDFAQDILESNNDAFHKATLLEEKIRGH